MVTGNIGCDSSGWQVDKRFLKVYNKVKFLAVVNDNLWNVGTGVLDGPDADTMRTVQEAGPYNSNINDNLWDVGTGEDACPCNLVK